MSEQLLDFLYSDHERVASFLAQISGMGALTNAEKTASKQKKGQFEGGADIHMFKAGGRKEQSYQKDIRQTYDPLWINSKSLIDAIEAKNANETLSVGDMRILSGKLMCFDYSHLNKILSNDHIIESIANSMDGENGVKNPYTKKNKAITSENKKNAAIIRDYLQQVDLGIGFLFFSNNNVFFFNVKKEYLQLQNLDIPLKFPLQVSGSWNILCILDAEPNDHFDLLEDMSNKKYSEIKLPEMIINTIHFTTIIASLFGRNVTNYGISPLVIYRGVNL